MCFREHKPFKRKLTQAQDLFAHEWAVWEITEDSEGRISEEDSFSFHLNIMLNMTISLVHWESNCVALLLVQKMVRDYLQL